MTTKLAQYLSYGYFKVAQSQLSEGTRVEKKEHGKDFDALAKQVAKAHLKEDPRYYTHLKAMEEGKNPFVRDGVKEALDAKTIASAASKRGVSPEYLQELVHRAGHRRRYFKAMHREDRPGGMVGVARQHTSWTWPDDEKKQFAQNYIASKTKSKP